MLSDAGYSTSHVVSSCLRSAVALYTFFADLQWCLFVLLTLATLSGTGAFPTANADLSETSGEEQDAGSDSGHKWLDLAKQLHRNIKTLCNEQLQKDFGDAISNTTKCATMRVQPLLGNTPNVCLSRNFDEDRCLKWIYTGLRTYRERLTYVERENLTATLINSVKHSTISLLNVIKDKLSDATHNRPLALGALPDGTAWTRRTVTQSILHNFMKFMEDTSRVIKVINKKNMGTPYPRKDTQEGEWLPAKQLH